MKNFHVFSTHVFHVLYNCNFGFLKIHVRANDKYVIFYVPKISIWKKDDFLEAETELQCKTMESGNKLKYFIKLNNNLQFHVFN